jgi:hypothetical protein
MKILLNAILMATELAAIVGLAWLGWNHPFVFAGLTVALSLVLGLRLEFARLAHELPFYFRGREGLGTTLRAVMVRLVSSLEAILKAILAGIAAIFTFSGTDPDRLFWVAVVFAATVYAGASVLRVVSHRLGGAPLRWGYFRLSVPLGLLFSGGIAALAGLSIITQATISDMGWKILWELPPKPDINQVSELLFGLKQAFDDFVVRILSNLVSEGWAEGIAVAISVNVLTGFVAALYASVIATAVRGAEIRLF